MRNFSNKFSLASIVHTLSFYERQLAGVAVLQWWLWYVVIVSICFYEGFGSESMPHATACHILPSFGALRCRAELTALATSERPWMDFNPMREPHAVQALQHRWVNLRFIRRQSGDARAELMFHQLHVDITQASCRHHVGNRQWELINENYAMIILHLFRLCCKCFSMKLRKRYALNGADDVCRFQWLWSTMFTTNVINAILTMP